MLGLQQTSPLATSTSKLAGAATMLGRPSGRTSRLVGLHRSHHVSMGNQTRGEATPAVAGSVVLRSPGTRLPTSARSLLPEEKEPTFSLNLSGPRAFSAFRPTRGADKLQRSYRMASGTRLGRVCLPGDPKTGRQDFRNERRVSDSLLDEDSQRSGSMSRTRQQCFKTKMCHFFLQQKCSRGSNCLFAHSADELRLTPDLSKTKICVKWKKGQCFADASQCTYAHGACDLRPMHLEDTLLNTVPSLEDSDAASGMMLPEQQRMKPIGGMDSASGSDLNGLTMCGNVSPAALTKVRHVFSCAPHPLLPMNTNPLVGPSDEVQEQSSPTIPSPTKRGGKVTETTVPNNSDVSLLIAEKPHGPKALLASQQEPASSRVIPSPLPMGHRLSKDTDSQQQPRLEFCPGFVSPQSAASPVYSAAHHPVTPFSVASTAASSPHYLQMNVQPASPFLPYLQQMPGTPPPHQQQQQQQQQPPPTSLGVGQQSPSSLPLGHLPRPYLQQSPLAGTAVPNASGDVQPMVMAPVQQHFLYHNGYLVPVLFTASSTPTGEGQQPLAYPPPIGRDSEQSVPLMTGFSRERSRFQPPMLE